MTLPTKTLGRLPWGAVASPEGRRRVREHLAGGGIVAYPTESSYALGADPANPEAVGSVFRAKGRPADKPLPVVAGSAAQLERLGVELPAGGLLGLEKAWPGPLTIVLPCAPGIAAASGRRELAVRVPGGESLRRLLLDVGTPLTATSANRSGEPPVLEPSGLESLAASEPVLILDGGVLAGGEPSTIVRLDAGTLVVLRLGAIGAGELARLAPAARIELGFSATSVEIPVEERR